MTDVISDLLQEGKKVSGRWLIFLVMVGKWCGDQKGGKWIMWLRLHIPGFYAVWLWP